MKYFNHVQKGRFRFFWDIFFCGELLLKHYFTQFITLNPHRVTLPEAFPSPFHQQLRTYLQEHTKSNDTVSLQASNTQVDNGLEKVDKRSTHVWEVYGYTSVALIAVTSALRIPTDIQSHRRARNSLASICMSRTALSII
jgi:hypothetical protein